MIKWIFGGLASFFTIRYLSRLHKASSNITTRIALKVHQISLKGIVLKAVVVVQNPNPITLRLQHPFVKVLFKEQLLATSVIENSVIEIGQHSQKTFDIELQSAGWITLIQILGVQIASDIREGKRIALPIETLTTTTVNTLPYQDRQKITLQL